MTVPKPAMESIAPQWWLRMPLALPAWDYIIVHGTFGTQATLDQQYEATKHWFQAVENSQPGNWGSCAHYIVGPDAICEVIDPDKGRPNWSAGYGSGGALATWSADSRGISIEVAGLPNVPYDARTIERVADLCAWLVERYDIPLQRIPYLAQTTVPNPESDRGFVGHEDTSNGHRWGKIDPGPLFPYDDLFNKIRKRIHKEDSMPDPTPVPDQGYGIDWVIDDMQPAQIASPFERGQVDLALSWCPPAARQRVKRIVVESLGGGAEGGLRYSSERGGYDLLLHPRLFLDPVPPGESRSTPTNRLREVVVHEVAGHLWDSLDPDDPMDARLSAQQVVDYGRRYGLNPATASPSGIRNEAWAQLVEDWIVRPALIRKLWPQDEAWFLDVWREAAGAGDQPPTMDWIAGSGPAFVTNVNISGWQEDSNGWAASPRGMLSLYGWSTLTVWEGEHHYWQGPYADFPIPQAGIDDPIPENAVMYRRW